MGSSFYLQIAPYLLLEYTYGDNTSTYISNQVKLARIKNDYLDGQIQFLNTSPSINLTQNVLDTSAANLGGYKWAYLDVDVPAPYINTDTKLTYTDLSNLLTSLYVTYDRVRVHILSGYRLEDLEGLIIQIYGREAQTSKVSVLANNVYLNSDDRDILNPKPILLGEKLYDRYVEILIPSIKGINEDFYADPTNNISIGYQYTSDNRGFLFNTPIYVKVYEINKTEKKNAILYLFTSNEYTVNVNQEDAYSGLSANIQEATDGDYFNYYPTYKGNFIEDFMSQLNAAGGDYIIINDVDVYEQVGLDNLLTFSFSQVQQGGYDGPLEFRPILKYTDTAVSFAVDYTVRIFNKLNAFQLIRRASTTSFNVRKYGKQLDRIKLAQQSYPMKVYNKVFSKDPVSFMGSEGLNTGFSTVYVPIFFETRNIVSQVKSVLQNGADPTNPSLTGTIYFGQGDARIYLSDFDSFYKFSINQLNNTDGSITKVDLTSTNVQIAFKDSAGNIITIPAQTSTAENSKADGEVVFNLPGTLKKKVLYDNMVKTFNLVGTVEGSDTTVMYTGTVDAIENIAKETGRVQEVAASASGTAISTTAPTAATTSSTTTTTTTAGTPTSSTTALSNTLGNVKGGESILDALTKSNAVAVNSVKGTTQVQPPVIPGYSNDPGAESVLNGITPVEDSTNKQTSVTTGLTKQGGTSTTIKNSTGK
jgi:hypothetical protein